MSPFFSKNSLLIIYGSIAKTFFKFVIRSSKINPLKMEKAPFLSVLKMKSLKGQTNSLRPSIKIRSSNSSKLPTKTHGTKSWKNSKIGNSLLQFKKNIKIKAKWFKSFSKGTSIWNFQNGNKKKT
jgi:hypothetical protein